MKYEKGSFFYRLVIMSIKVVFKLFYRYRVYGLDHYIPGRALIASNHTSFFDPPAAAIACPEPIHFLARASLFKSFLGLAIRNLNTHPVYNGEHNLKVMKAISQFLQEESKVLLFPEGTRSFDGQLGEVKRGMALLFFRNRCAIIPMYIHGTFKIWNQRRLFPKPWGKVAVIFGSPIRYEDYADINRKEGEGLVVQRFTDAMRALHKWYEEGAEGSPP